MGIDQSEPTIIKFILGLGLVWAIALTNSLSLPTWRSSITITLTKIWAKISDYWFIKLS
ncbi:MAG: hypothetical protein F6K25_21930 [Okeania sp. SIO2G4]|uniref:hypothetical protein n=1 Tax=unclassified Okeania TaxID=2634635 RepID=UPI0013BCE26A|nr:MULTISPECIES: hypothetical protein [unclassified Okeania]NEP06997.1 hypothetical protein [Okeania sp. SIO4D6]NEP45989.1 hypothetical protein [Okeania sp. SIO2H7]NEP72899.1 hypothetical protein [Okeania sp. SIO2G5]NEP93709.1 hypothetical protein [Okeania sp. SIO2F5]NEQ93177.1 hypothetical protein [Okeania sp. SIO2G4]